MECLQWLLEGGADARRVAAVGFFSEPEVELSGDEVWGLEGQLISALAIGDAAEALDAAERLMAAGCYQEAQEAYAQLADSDVEERAVCLAQIGAARLALGRYAGALQSYAAARDEGADPNLIDDALWEVCEAWAGADPRQRSAVLARYSALCPQGRHLAGVAVAQSA